ncbi:NAD(P)-binding protein [Trametes sanguinea]|nr:NAD(P)-binding protein [Trametes sanguinea]
MATALAISMLTPSSSQRDATHCSIYAVAVPEQNSMPGATHSVAILGGTGLVGKQISLVFLTEFKSIFPTVRILTRDPASASAQELAGKGASLVKWDGSNLPNVLDEVLKGVDTVVNALSVNISAEAKQAVLEAVARNPVKVYFLDEFGFDHGVDGFPGSDHPEWINKRRIAADTRRMLQGKKVIALYCGVLFDYAITPLLGVDIEKNVYSAYGLPSQKFSIASRTDVARTVARLAALALDPTTAAKVPDEVRIAAATVSHEDIRDIVARVKGVPKGEVKGDDLQQHKENLRQHPGENFIDYLRVIMGDGKADYSSNNANELVNPDQAFWKWETVGDYVRKL